jgi:hypothetical protein
MTRPTIPVVDEIAVRVSENGEFFGLDLECRDGTTRSAIFEISVATRLIATLLWGAAEAGARGGGGAEEGSEGVRNGLRAGAPRTRFVETVADADGHAVAAEFAVGAATLILRLDRSTALDLAESLVRAFDRDAKH